MLLIDELEDTKLHRVRTACAYLFSCQLAQDNGFLKSLKLETIKSAFRQKAKRYHPDVQFQEPEVIINRRIDRFIKIRNSYEILISHFQEMPPPVTEKGPGQGKIIAIGGAKGGIGKSIFTANLGVLLSSMGWRTVVADLDIGGSNLHLYLGETFLKLSINDFLNKKAPDLQKIMIRNKYGPHLIGGDSSQLGAANISFSQKLKLLKAIKQIDADYIIIDLGGDTSYNIIDFFLAADYGIVMTTCDPASYLDAYNFIKVGIYRRLNRLFGPESKFRDRKDDDLKQLIHDATMSSNGLKVKSIGALLERVEKQQPRNLPLIKEVMSTFNIYLLLNRVTPNSDEIQLVRRIQKVSRLMLSVNIEYLGSLPYQPEIEHSARDLIPIVARYPKGTLAKKMSRIIEDLLHVSRKVKYSAKSNLSVN